MCTQATHEKSHYNLFSSKKRNRASSDNVEVPDSSNNVVTDDEEEKEKKEQEETTSVGGIVIPVERLGDKPRLAFVVQAGPGKHENGSLVPNPVKGGDTVILPLVRQAGASMHVDGEMLRLFKAGELVGCVRPPAYREGI
jgi:co-chaperonin GroES (HSP10)